MDLVGPDRPEWRKILDKRAFAIYTADSDMPGATRTLLSGTMHVPAEKLFETITLYDAFNEFMPYMNYSRLLSEDIQGPDRCLRLAFFFTTPPLVSPRFYTLALTDEKNADAKPGVFRSLFTQETGEHAISPDDGEIREHVKKYRIKKPVETKHITGAWVFEPETDPAATRVSYYLHMHPGGAIPSRVMDMANVVALPKLWKALKQRARGAT